MGKAGEDEAHHADASRTHDPELGPSEQESEVRAVRSTQINVVAAFVRNGGREFDITQGRGKRDQTTNDPNGHQLGDRIHVGRDLRSDLVDSRSDHNPGDDANRVEKRQLPAGFWMIGGVGRHIGLSYCASNE